MRGASELRTATRIGWNKLLLGLVVILMAMVGLALLAEAMSGGEGTVYLANISAPSAANASAPSIIVTDHGRASAPAERASIQLMLSQPEGGYRGVIRDDEATPAAGSAERVMVEPILSALSAQGLDPDQIAVLSSPAFGNYCYGPGCSSPIRLDFSLDQPDIDQINTIINTAQTAAAEINMSIIRVGVAYTVSDCALVQRKAREQAAADARRRAEDQASVLTIELGALLLSSESAPAQSMDMGGCGMILAEPGLDYYGPSTTGLSLPPFDPAAPAEAVADVQVSLAFAIPASESDE